MSQETKLDFQAYQRAFTKRIRNPESAPLPDQVEPERMAVYESLIFNNLLESVSLCFPVARTVLGKDAWESLVRRYFACYASNTPIFREIPQTFVEFITQEDAKSPINPPFLLSLCHYEWVELALSTQSRNPTPDQLVTNITTADALLHQPLWFISPLMLLHYDYPVHTITADNQPRAISASYLLVYRDDSDDIQFVTLNATTYLLLKHLIEDQMTAETTLTEISEALQQPKEAIVGFGLSFLHDFYQKGIVKGFLSNVEGSN